MNKIQLVKEVASEGAKLKRKIINAIAEDEPQSHVTAAAVNQLFAELNELVQGAPLKKPVDDSKSARIKKGDQDNNAQLTTVDGEDKLVAVNIALHANKLSVTDNKGNNHFIEDVEARAGKYMRINWKFEDDVLIQFEEESQDKILEALEKSNPDYFA